MTVIDNKALIQDIMDARARRDPGPFIAAMADDFVWRITGSTAWSGDYVGKADVLERLMKPLSGQFTAPNSLTLSRIICEGDYVVAECRGNATTLAGELYANTYCFVIRMTDGKLRELTEYMDTTLVGRVLRPPGNQ
ncbi:nuclear transport factor 2 family protein [Bradyrhizobium sp. DASA03005]|uniref:nuclear transport factor 2 family protein n=1 Tax=Bradyrhizobium TaxID=374 RepID=UPI001BAC610A|nr:nuclear transport factor 2 family protein [Bradyrhizobium liaoningense]MBR1166878.1 nuclear transport factor 2 family protein [Bradyrhizobium liaoningense]